MRRIRAALTSDVDGTPRHSPLVVPRPVDGLVCKRVLVMDYLDGEPLSRAVEQARILSGMGRLGTRLSARILARSRAHLGRISRRCACAASTPRAPRRSSSAPVSSPLSQTHSVGPFSPTGARPATALPQLYRMMHHLPRLHVSRISAITQLYLGCISAGSSTLTLTRATSSSSPTVGSGSSTLARYTRRSAEIGWSRSDEDLHASARDR